MSFESSSFTRRTSFAPWSFRCLSKRRAHRQQMPRELYRSGEPKVILNIRILGVSTNVTPNYLVQRRGNVSRASVMVRPCPANVQRGALCILRDVTAIKFLPLSFAANLTGALPIKLFFLSPRKPSPLQRLFSDSTFPRVALLHSKHHSLQKPSRQFALDTKKMPPKRTQAAVARSGGPRAEPGFAQRAYRELTAAENQSVVRSLAVFGVSPGCDLAYEPVENSWACWTHFLRLLSISGRGPGS